MRPILNFHDLAPDGFNKPAVTKAQLAEWLFSAVDIIDRCSNPLMSCALHEIHNLKSEKFDDQKTIIKSQNEVIRRKMKKLTLSRKLCPRNYSLILLYFKTPALLALL